MRRPEDRVGKRRCLLHIRASSQTSSISLTTSGTGTSNLMTPSMERSNPGGVSYSSPCPESHPPRHGPRGSPTPGVCHITIGLGAGSGTLLLASLSGSLQHLQTSRQRLHDIVTGFMNDVPAILNDCHRRGSVRITIPPRERHTHRPTYSGAEWIAVPW